MAEAFHERYVEDAIRQLENVGVEFVPGLSESALSGIESALGAPLPPELRLFLGAAVPQGEGWPDWAGDPLDVVASALGWITERFAFDVRQNDYWFEPWGERPGPLEDAVALAVEKVRAWPSLVPLYLHRFMPTEPRGWGNPVLSVWQAVDSIYYGFDFAAWLHMEFGIPLPTWAARSAPVVPVWGEAFELLGPA